jgi:hypothetical protein
MRNSIYHGNNFGYRCISYTIRAIEVIAICIAIAGIGVLALIDWLLGD